MRRFFQRPLERTSPTWGGGTNPCGLYFSHSRSGLGTFGAGGGHMLSRRDLGKLLVGAPFSAWACQGRPAVTTVAGVVFGVETFSFHDLPPSGDSQLIPTIISNLKALGIAECEIMSGHIEPFASVMTGWWVQSRRAADFQRLREEARRWRLSVPMTYYRTIRRQFEDAGLRIHFYNVNFNETFTD